MYTVITLIILSLSVMLFFVCVARILPALSAWPDLSVYTIYAALQDPIGKNNLIGPRPK